MSLIDTSPTTPEATVGVVTTDLSIIGAAASETSALSMLLGYDTSVAKTSGLGVAGSLAANDMDAIFWLYWMYWLFGFILSRA
jgi:hypothetical protein